MAFFGITVIKSRSCVAIFSKRLLAEHRNSRSLSFSPLSLQQSLRRAEEDVAASPEAAVAPKPAPPRRISFLRPQYDGDPGQNLRKPKLLDNHLFAPFYHYPYITMVRALTKLKIFQTGLTFVMVPVVTMMYANGNLSVISLMAAVGANLFAIGALFAFSHFFRRWIGRMYVDETKKYVLVSHLDFWGNRRDEVLRIEDVVPLDNSGENVMDVYVRFDRLDYPKKYFYGNLSAGGILEPEVFKDVFGVLPLLDRQPNTTKS